ncbi:MAG: helicase HerA-like domain-containing protein [Hyphomicrobiaceae bacterium]|nr:helicase HerA-like domain-containing protein [Hyphomicrobiaceae bacterium]
MHSDAGEALPAEGFAAAFEHSITWEDDIWHADPVDVELVHQKARSKFADLLRAVVGGGGSQSRILLFHGQSGAGKTHLIRALRTASHRECSAYFGYAQMTPDIGSYADYFLKRLVNSLEKPYDPDHGGESALTRLTNRLVGDSAVLPVEELEALREAQLDDRELARFVVGLADDIVASPKFAAEGLDINIVRALLYLQRGDPRIDQRVRQYLHGRPLNLMAQEAVAALDPVSGDGRAFEIVESLGRLMWTVDRAALVFCIDQVEDLRFFDDFDKRFQRAVADLTQMANLVPTSIVIISCLDDFYDQVRKLVAQSFVDRIEKAGPIALLESRTPAEARLIISKRLEHEVARNGGGTFPDPVDFFGPRFFEEFSGLSTRRLLEHAQARLKAKLGEAVDETVAGAEEASADDGFISTLAAALGFSLPQASAPPPALHGTSAVTTIDFQHLWDRFQAESEAEMPPTDHDLLDVLADALAAARDEWRGHVRLAVTKLSLGDELPGMDISVTHGSNVVQEARVFICNKPTQGGGLKRQLDRVLTCMKGKQCFMLRASDFPPNRKNQTAQAFRRFREVGGRSLLVPIPEWERMITVREFTQRNRQQVGFADWHADAKLLSGVLAVIQLLRLDLLGRPSLSPPPPALVEAAEEAGRTALHEPMASAPTARHLPVSDLQSMPMDPLADWTGWGRDTMPALPMPPAAEPAEEELQLTDILDENATDASSILAGRELGGRSKLITLNKSILKRHAAVLGGSGSGKTTLALSLIEQLLLRGTPAILIDRKGDLCSYANPDVWRANENDFSDRRGDREKLADQIDVAVYTPGRASGRPISITLLPDGMNELPEHEQQLLANLSAAALGDMLHLKNSATHQRQSGTLSVALKILGSRSSKQVSLGDLIYLLEEEDPELTELTQRMDPSGKIRRDLIGQLDSLRHRNSALFEGGGEPLRMESLLGLGPFARPDGRTRLSIIYTGFLGDNENILFWVAQFLSEALRFCQRNPNDQLQALVMLDEADLYIPATAKPATSEPLQSLLKRARSAGLGIMLATQSPGDLDYKSRDQITSWFIGRVREDTALKKLKSAFQSESGLDAAAVLPSQTVGEFHLVQEGVVRALKAQRSLIQAEQVPFDRIEQLAHETKGQDERQLKLFA